MRLFFYGTMMDPEVRRIVLAEEAEALLIQPARLGGYRRVCAKPGDYPLLVRRTAGRVHGELVSGLSPEGLCKVAHFEGPDYRPQERGVIDGAGGRIKAWVMLPRNPARATNEAWDLRRWQLRHKARLLPPLRRWMAEYAMMGRYSVDIPWSTRRILARQAGQD